MIQGSINLRGAIRALLGARVFTAGVIVSLALVIAATAVVYAVLQAVVLRPLPFAEPERLVWIWATRTDRDRAFFSIPDYLDFVRANTTLSAVAAYANWGVNLTGVSQPERLQGAKVSGGAFTLLGVAPAVGRTLTPIDDERADRVVVISDAFWQRRFGGTWSAVGSRVQLNGEDYEIVGVLPPNFLFPGVDAQVFGPLAPSRDPRRLDRGTNFLRVFGRLVPGGSKTAVADEWGRIARELRAAFPESNAKKTEPRVLSLDDEILGPHRAVPMIMMGAVLALWLLACTNILNLQFIRLSTRDREAAIRAALGGATRHLIAPPLIESTLLVAVGGTAGTILAAASLPTLVAGIPVTLPRGSDIRIDMAVIAFTLAIVSLTALIVAVWPVIGYARRRNVQAVLRAASTRASGSTSHGLTRNAVVVFEIAATLCLGLTTAHLVNAYRHILREDVGIRIDGLVQTRLSLPSSRYATRVELERYLQLAMNEVRAIPGVSRVAAANALPLSAQNIRTDFSIVGDTLNSSAEMPGAQNRWVTPGYFETLGIPVVEGRTFTDHDLASRAAVAIIDRELSRLFWPGRTPVGTRVRIADGTPEGRVLEIVGVVGNVTHFDIGEAPLGTLYGPIHQIPPSAVGFFAGNFMMAVEATANSDETPRAIAAAVRRVDPDVPIAMPSPIKDQMARLLASRTFVATALGFFAVAALLLAVSGVYAVVSAAARERNRELAIRLALGAPAQSLMRLVIGLAARLMAFALPIGLAFAVVTLRLMPALMNVENNGWLIWVSAPLVIVGVGLAASYWRARRVLAIDPLVILKMD